MSLYKTIATDALLVYISRWLSKYSKMFTDREKGGFAALTPGLTSH